jgi:hypothetical protein
MPPPRNSDTLQVTVIVGNTYVTSACCMDAGECRRRAVHFNPPDLPVMPHKYNADRRHHIPRPKRRVTNWSEYNEALRQRGSVWFTDEAIAAWKAAPRRAVSRTTPTSRLRRL